MLRWASDWDAAGAVADARRATELNPQYPLGHTHRAIVLSALGRHDEAFAWLDRALSDRNLQAALHVNGDPRLAPIASDPRMTAILQRMRLRSESGPTVAPTIEIR